MENKKKNGPKVSIIIPAKDEEETIGKILKDINTTINRLQSYVWEIIVVADHCNDKTEEIARKYCKTVLINQNNQGKGNALKVGFENATGDIIIMMDADYSHRAEDIVRFLTAIAPAGIGLVIGSRSLGGSDEYTFIRTLGNIFLTNCVNFLFHLNLSDSLNGFKAFKCNIIKNHVLSSSTFEIEIELICYTLLEKEAIIEISSHERQRAGGKMKSNAIIHGTKFLLCIINKGLQYNFYCLRRLFSER